MNYRIKFKDGTWTEILAFNWTDITAKYDLKTIQSIDLL